MVYREEYKVVAQIVKMGTVEYIRDCIEEYDIKRQKEHCNDFMRVQNVMTRILYATQLSQKVLNDISDEINKEGATK